MQGRKTGDENGNTNIDYGLAGTFANWPFLVISYHLGLVARPYIDLSSVDET